MKRTRFVVECTAPGAKGDWAWERRSRKFSDPLYMTDQGYLAVFPEVVEHLFDTPDQAHAAIQKFGKPEHAPAWRIGTTTLEQQLKDKRYLRWLKEVKPHVGAYTEPKRTLDECAVIYRQGGLAALRKIYTKAHAFKLEKSIVEAGLSPKEDRQVSSPFVCRVVAAK